MDRANFCWQIFQTNDEGKVGKKLLIKLFFRCGPNNDVEGPETLVMGSRSPELYLDNRIFN